MASSMADMNKKLKIFFIVNLLFLVNNVFV
nr:MAG TPA: immunity protein [Caudoviricetes sp.]